MKLLQFITGLKLEGVCNTIEREKVIEDAISRLQTDPENAFATGFMGIKNYASFGDQRCDCEYGTGPRHGEIVFSIGRGKDYDPKNANEYIRILLIFRDAGSFELEKKRYNLYSAYKMLMDNEMTNEKIKEWLELQAQKSN